MILPNMKAGIKNLEPIDLNNGEKKNFNIIQVFCYYDIMLRTCQKKSLMATTSETIYFQKERGTFISFSSRFDVAIQTV